jgi:biotin transport system substrate-specific component
MRDIDNTVSRAIGGDAARADPALGVLGFAALTALGAKVAVYLPGTPVPMTLQTLAVPLAALALGPRLGMASMGVYLLMGSFLGPLFADPAKYGLVVLMGPTGGYLLGFVLAQPVVNALARGHSRARGAGRGHGTRLQRHRLEAGATGCRPAPWGRMVAGVFAGQCVIFVCGVVWLWAVVWAADASYTVADALRQGLFPFVVGDLLKVAAAGAVAPWLVRFSCGRGW